MPSLLIVSEESMGFFSMDFWTRRGWKILWFFGVFLFLIRNFSFDRGGPSTMSAEVFESFC